MINSNENQPFEASYEAAKQSIISFMGEVSRVYDIPMPLLNLLIYEIALECRNATFSAIIGGCEIKYPDKLNPDDISSSNPTVQGATIHHSMPAKEAIEEFKKMGIEVNEIDNTSDISA